MARTSTWMGSSARLDASPEPAACTSRVAMVDRRRVGDGRASLRRPPRPEGLRVEALSLWAGDFGRVPAPLAEVVASTLDLRNRLRLAGR